MPLEDHKIALFIDFENIALGVKDTSYKTFDVQLVLARLLEKGKVVARRAYADWDRYGSYKRGFHEAGIELIDIPLKAYSGKNSADIRMVVDALDLCYAKEHVTTFALVSGDSDFSPLVSKLRENDKYVIGLGVKNSTSELLVASCDEFIFYEDLIRAVQEAPPLSGLPKKQRECFALLSDSIKALMRDGKDVLWGSMIKQAMQRKRPEFNEEYFGYSTFSALLEDAEKHHVVRLRRDQRSGTYVVTGFDSGEASARAPEPEAEPEEKPTAKARRPRRRSRKTPKAVNQNA
ncbi:MAG: NYN domain-containing protein [Thermoanaerobaculaceae bacterium]|nr:NYN domain-containing protein [Thermoanaerobaculaceae bacterium]